MKISEARYSAFFFRHFQAWVIDKTNFFNLTNPVMTVYCWKALLKLSLDLLSLKISFQF